MTEQRQEASGQRAGNQGAARCTTASTPSKTNPGSWVHNRALPEGHVDSNDVVQRAGGQIVEDADDVDPWRRLSRLAKFAPLKPAPPVTAIRMWWPSPHVDPLPKKP